MGNSKVIFGNETLIDLTGDTVTPDTLLAGTTAHNRSGNQIVGTATVPDTLDDLTDVELTSPAEGDLLQRNGNGEWVNSAVIPQKVAGLQETGCVNLFDNKVSSQVVGGVTFVANGDKSVTLHGTSTENIIIPLNTDFSLPVGRNLIWSSGKSLLPSNVYLTIKTGTGSGSSGDTVASCDNRAYAIPFTVPNVGAFHTYLWIGSGVTFNNYTIYPMASYFYTGYQPYSMTNRELTEVVTGFSTNGWISFYKVGKVCTCKIVANAVTLAAGDTVGDIPDGFLPVTDALQMIEVVSMRMFSISKNNKTITTNHAYNNVNIRATQTWVCE